MIDFQTVFSDITPVPQNEGKEPPVCSIAYAPEFIEAYDYLRALLRKDERSNRALDLTTLCLKLNPANYTVWHYRRMILVELGGGGIDDAAITKDLDFADDLGGTNPKNYQLWYHRRALLEIRFKNATEENGIDAAKKELKYVDRILEDDSKNYHAWSHRQWIIRTMKNSDLWKSEIEYSHTKIKDDPRNNSAWSQRWFATHRGQVASFAGLGTFISCDELRKKGVILSSELADEEAHYALCGAEIDPYNESPWRYLIGVLMEQWRCAQRENNSHEISKAVELITNNISNIKELKHSLKDNPPLKEGAAPCVSLMSALVDLLELFVENEELLKEASNLCKELAEVDTVRRKYWRKRDANVMNII